MRAELSASLEPLVNPAIRLLLDVLPGPLGAWLGDVVSFIIGDLPILSFHRRGFLNMSIMIVLPC